MFPLLLFSAWLNYIDRGTLSVAAPVIAPEFGMDPQRVGILLSAFFWTYATLQPVAGWVVDRYPVKWVYGLGFAFWTGATLLTGFSGGFVTLLACRVLLGIGESVAYPCYSKVITNHFPEGRRGIANALIDAGTKGGPAVGNFIAATFIASAGWRPFFIGLGAITFLWLLPWSRVTLNDGPVAGHRSEPAPPMSALLTRGHFWGTCFGLFLFNYNYYFLLTWLPSYLVNERKLDLKAMGIVGALPWLATVAAAIGFGLLSDRAIRNGASAGRLRPTVVVAGEVLCALALPFARSVDPWVAYGFMIVAFAGVGVATSNIWAYSQLLAGPTLSGRWTGIQNGFGNLGGVAAPILTGYLVKTTGTFESAFLTSAAAVFLSGVCYAAVFWLVRRNRFAAASAA
ncbi:MAG: MFS transporter [Bryobacteraceae bacterium]